MSSPCCLTLFLSFFFFFNDTATTAIYTLSLHDALPLFISDRGFIWLASGTALRSIPFPALGVFRQIGRAHVELQSRRDLVCRLLLEKKKEKEAFCVYVDKRNQEPTKREGLIY